MKNWGICDFFFKTEKWSELSEMARTLIGKIRFFFFWKGGNFFGGSTFVGGQKGGDLEFLCAQTRERGLPFACDSI